MRLPTGNSLDLKSRRVKEESLFLSLTLPLKDLLLKTKSIFHIDKFRVSWDFASLTMEQQEAIEEFQNVVDNFYPWEYIKY